jgi:pycsar effector protein
MTTTLPDGLSIARDQVLDELRRADTKATTLLSLVGAAMAGVIALANQHLAVVAAVLLWVSLAPIFASVVLLLLAIRPRLNRNPVPGSWLYAAHVEPDTLMAAYGDDHPTVVAGEVCILARVARTKYLRIRTALVLLLTGLVALVVSLIVMAATS